GSCRGAQPHDGTCSSAVRPYCLRSKTWGSLRPHVHLCNNAPPASNGRPGPFLAAGSGARQPLRRNSRLIELGPQLASLIKAQLDQRTLFTTQVFVGSHRNTISLGRCFTSDLRPPSLKSARAGLLIAYEPPAGTPKTKHPGAEAAGVFRGSG
ncbi:MAG: hypothetical protein VB125_01795, partial [Burkholderia sp.]